MAEAQDGPAEAFAKRCKYEVAAQVLSGLTLSALSLAYRVWFSHRPPPFRRIGNGKAWRR